MVASNRPYREEYPEHPPLRETSISLYQRSAFQADADSMREAYEQYLRDFGEHKNPFLKTFDSLYEKDL